MFVCNNAIARSSIDVLLYGISALPEGTLSSFLGVNFSDGIVITCSYISVCF